MTEAAIACLILNQLAQPKCEGTPTGVGVIQPLRNEREREAAS